MKFPKPGSRTDKTLRAIHAEGAVTVNQITARITGLSRNMFWAISSDYKLIVSNGVYGLPDYLRSYFDGCEVQPEPVAAVEAKPVQRALPRSYSVFGPALTGYAEKLRAACRREGAELRDVSVKPCDISMEPWRVPQ
jgi:hypothetical protein